MNWKAWLALVIGFVLGVAVIGAAQSLLDGYKRSMAKRAAADCRVLSTAIETYRRDHGRYPTIDGDLDHLGRDLDPTYLRVMPRGNFRSPYLVVINGTRAAVIAVGSDGVMVEGGSIRIGRVEDEGRRERR